MTRRIKAHEAPNGERAMTTRQVPRLHPESFPIAPSHEITARRWDLYHLRRSHGKSTWAICWPRTLRCVLLVVAHFILRHPLSRRVDRSRKEIVFPNRVAVVGRDSHENSDRIKLPSPSFLFCHLVNDDNGFRRGILNIQKSSESTSALNRASGLIKLWGWQ